ncbi:MAG: radical SAM/SPASM domain-containing protein [Candidatus Korobacteraceae bacterium]
MTPPLPIRLQIETTDICNLKCRMCTREVIEGMNTKTIELDQFKKTIEEVSPYYVTLNGLGEPLLDKTIFEKLAFLHDQGIMTAMPTNGSYIRGEKLEHLARNLPDTLTFSIDGATRESFEYVRVRGDFNQIIANYHALLERWSEGNARPNTRIQVLCALQKANLGDFRQMYVLKKSMPEVHSFNLAPVFDYDTEGGTFRQLIPTREDVLKVHSEIDQAIRGTQDLDEQQFYSKWRSVSSVWLKERQSQEGTLHESACLVPWYSTYIDAKGQVYPCCYLLNSPHVMGNINEESFSQIWHGERYKKFRNSLVTGRKELTGCRTCPKNDDHRLRQLNLIRIAL